MHLWWLIVCIDLAGTWRAHIFDQILFWMFLWQWFWMCLIFKSINLVKQTALLSVWTSNHVKAWVEGKTDSPEIKALHPEKYTLHATSHQSLYKYPQLWTSTELCVYLWHKSCSDVIIARRQETSSLVIGTISFLPGGLAHRRDSIHLLNWHVIKVSIFYINFSFYKKYF